MIVRSIDDSILEENSKYWSFKVVRTAGSTPLCQGETGFYTRQKILLESRLSIMCYTLDYLGKIQTMSPEEISSLLLIKIKKMAELHLGCNVSHAVIAVPAASGVFQ
jgi:hypothetical protein